MQINCSICGKKLKKNGATLCNKCTLLTKAIPARTRSHSLYRKENPPIKKFLRSIDIEYGSECILWAAGRANGYGCLRIGISTSIRAYKFIYEWCIGVIPAGHDIHHSCGRQLCVNPSHLIAIPKSEHVKRTPNNPTTINMAKTHCPRGHEYNRNNTRIYRGYRYCRACRVVQNRPYKKLYRWRNSVLRRDDYLCVKCGGRGNGLHVHHIDGNVSSSEPETDVSKGITLCATCHKKEHASLTIRRRG